MEQNPRLGNFREIAQLRCAWRNNWAVRFTLGFLKLANYVQLFGKSTSRVISSVGRARSIIAIVGLEKAPRGPEPALPTPCPFGSASRPLDRGGAVVMEVSDFFGFQITRTHTNGCIKRTHRDSNPDLTSSRGVCSTVIPRVQLEYRRIISALAIYS